ncbi:MAG: ABC transporter ATP-binding protein [Nitrososphaeraceae archaeon]
MKEREQQQQRPQQQDQQEPLLRIKDLRTYFDTARGVVKAVDGVSLSIRPGEVAGLLGESGSGKTTLGLSITRLLPSPPGRIVVDGSSSSSIRFNGKELLTLSETEMRQIRGKEIGIIFQDPMTYLNPLMRIGDQIAERLVLHKNLSTKEATKKAVELLELVHIPSSDIIAKCYPHQLSGGMRQRVLIAIAIACEPALIIADEPTTALDGIVQVQILSLLRELKNKLRISVLLITHDLGVIMSLCDRAYVMYAGKIVEGASVMSLYYRPKHHYTHRMLTVANNMFYSTDLVTIEGAVPDLIHPPAGCRFSPRCPYADSNCDELEPPIEQEQEQEQSTNGSHEFACWRPVKYD